MAFELPAPEYQQLQDPEATNKRFANFYSHEDTHNVLERTRLAEIWNNGGSDQN